MKHNVLYITTDSHIGGTEKTIISLLSNINTEIYVPHMAVLRGGGELEDTYKEVSETYHALSISSILDLASGVKELEKVIDSCNITIIHSFLFHANIIARLVGKKRKNITIINSHRTVEKGKKWHLFVDRMTKRWVDYEIGNANVVSEYYITKTKSNPEKMRTIYNGIDILEDTIPSSSNKNGEIVFCCIGSFSRAKGQAVLLSAFKNAHAKDKNIKLIFVGDGHLRFDCELYAKENGMESYVKFVGKHTDIREYYNVCECVIIPSLWEGVPNVLFEAIAKKKSVIATDVGGVREIAASLKTVIITTPNDSDKLSECIENYCLRREDIAQCLDESREFVLSNYSINKMVRSYEEVYSVALEK